MGGNGQNGNGQGNEEGNQGQLAQPNNNMGPWRAGDPNNQGAGSGGPGISAGGPRPKGTEAPAAFKREQAPSQTIQNGKIIASHFIKASAEKGTSRVAASEVAEAAEKEATDEVEQERISKPAQKVVKQYFDDLKKGE